MLKGPGENTVIPSLLSISLPLEEVSLAIIIHRMHLLYGSALCYYMYDHSCCVSSSINLGKLMSLLRLQLLALQFPQPLFLYRFLFQYGYIIDQCICQPSSQALPLLFVVYVRFIYRIMRIDRTYKTKDSEGGEGEPGKEAMHLPTMLLIFLNLGAMF